MVAMVSVLQERMEMGEPGLLFACITVENEKVEVRSGR